jgi:hypothetical protein
MNLHPLYQAFGWKTAVLGLLGLATGAGIWGRPVLPAAAPLRCYSEAVRFGEAHLRAARRDYRPGDWPTLRRRITALYHLREYHALRLTNGRLSLPPPDADPYVDELQGCLDEGWRLAVTADRRQFLRHLETFRLSPAVEPGPPMGE